MADPLASWHAPDAQQAAGLLRHQLSMLRDVAAALVRQVEQTGPVEFVAELRIHTETTPAGQFAGATRWKLSTDAGGELGRRAAEFWRLDKLESDVEPRTAKHAGRRI